MASMFSLTAPKPITRPFNPHLPRLRRHHISVSASRLPSSQPPAPPGEVYQPFRRPPPPPPSKFRSLNPSERLSVLRDRIGLWHEYAPLVASLANDGFTPPSIEEATGLSGVDQNLLVVAAQVRDSLLSSSFDPALLPHFDSDGGADLLYELRLLNSSQRAAAAKRALDHCLDPKAARELARATRDFPRRRGDPGWTHFSAAHPGDCLAYLHLRASTETPADRIAALTLAMDAAETEEAKKIIAEEMERATGKRGDEDLEKIRVRVPIVRLKYGEVAEATTVAVVAVVRGVRELEAAPRWCKGEGGGLGVVAAERGWGRWVVLPGWEAVAGVEERVAVEFQDGRGTPWRWAREEAVLVVTDRRRTEVADEEGLYLVRDGEKELAVERGGKLLEKGVKEALGTAVLVVRPANEEDEVGHMIEDWE